MSVEEAKASGKPFKLVIDADGKQSVEFMSEAEVTEIKSSRASDEALERDYAFRRRMEYNNRGVTLEAIAEALIENAGGRNQKLLELIKIRDAVRSDIQKP